MTATAVRIDAHHHVWRLARGDYGWLTPELAAIHRDFMLDDLAPLLDGAGITATVLVQAAPTVAETEFLLRTAADSDGRVGGVVGWVDLAATDALCRVVASRARSAIEVDPPDAAGSSGSRMDPARGSRPCVVRAAATSDCASMRSSSRRNCRRCGR